jgi:ABC-type multidrug transport system ATPase subunit
MPQEISLFYDFTIEENLRYFGRLYGMNDNSINNKISELLSLLELPEKSRLVCEMSDGQRRRVSLCVALIHSPQLVILDEPTVGTDSILRHEIWNYLSMICTKHSITVIITTHYIEEARNASTVAYLTNGQIIVQQKPDVLLEKYNCNKIEDVLLILCENNIKEINEENINMNYSDHNKYKIISNK